MQHCQRSVTRLCITSYFARKFNPRTLKFFSTDNNIVVNDKNFEETTNNDGNEMEKKIELSGFAKSFAKFSEPKAPEPQINQSFANLLRHSNFIDLGDPEGKIVSGRIFHVVDDDLYVDFGWKFYCVCQRPLKNASDYVRDALVRVRIKDLELSTKFLGATKDLTILEADCTLTSLISSPMRNVTTM